MWRLYVNVEYVLTGFPWTRGLGLGLADTVARPLRVFADGAISVFPKLVFLAVFIFVTRYLLKVVRLFFDAVGAGGGRVRAPVRRVFYAEDNRAGPLFAASVGDW